MVGVHSHEKDFDSVPEVGEAAPERAALLWRTAILFMRMRPPVLVELAYLGFWPRLFGEEEGNPAWRLHHYGRIFHALLTDAKQQGLRVVVLEYPALSIPEAVQDLIRFTAEANGVEYVPLAHLFPDYTHFALYDSIHPDRQGHREIAAALVDFLARPPPAPLPAPSQASR
jgi:hypothetical protein